MALNEVLDRKINKIFGLREDNTLDVGFNTKSWLDNIESLMNFVKDDESKEYVLKRAITVLSGKIRLEICEQTMDLIGNEEALEIYESSSDNLSDFVDDLRIKLYDYGFNYSDEMFTKDEFEDLKSKLSDIAQSIYKFQQRQDAANEIIFNSVEELRDEFIKEAEKGKIFGKEFVKQQLAGKIMDMAFKGSFFAMLSYAPEQISDIANHVKGLL